MKPLFFFFLLLTSELFSQSSRCNHIIKRILNYYPLDQQEKIIKEIDLFKDASLMKIVDLQKKSFDETDISNKLNEYLREIVIDRLPSNVQVWAEYNFYEDFVIIL